MGRFARKQGIDYSRARTVNAKARADFSERRPALKAWRSRQASNSSQAESSRGGIINTNSLSRPNSISRFFKGRLALKGRGRRIARLSMVAALSLLGVLIGWSVGGALTEAPAASANKIATAQADATGGLPVLPTPAVGDAQHTAEQVATTQSSTEPRDNDERKPAGRRR